MSLTLENLQKTGVHLLGIGGIGVSALARMLLQSNVPVSGCDVRESTLTTALRAEGVDVRIGHSPKHLANSEAVVYSTAVPEDNPELAAARESNSEVLHRSELLGVLCDQHFTVGVTGTNGKGTVATMITWILEAAGMEPSFYIGGLCPNLGTNARCAGSGPLVAELDESDGSLVNIQPRWALLNNLELDHLNYYRDFDQAVATIETFFGNLGDDARGFFNADDEGTRKVSHRLPGLSKVFFGKGEDADYRFETVEVLDTTSRFVVTSGGESVEYVVNVPGAYNIENAVGAIAVTKELGVPTADIRRGLATFRGLDNRYTVLRAGGRQLIKDYMSHPTGIRKVLATARLGEPERLIAVFKPYRYTMIRYHAKNYATAFAGADEVIITDMWEGGEEPIPGVDTSWLVEQMREAGLNVRHLPEMELIPPYLMDRSAPGDCVVFFGGNDLFELAEGLARKLSGGEHG